MVVPCISSRAMRSIALVMSLSCPSLISVGHAAAQPGKCRPTRADFKAIRTGMTYEAASARLGCRGSRVSQMTIGDNRRATYSWRGRGSYGANLNLTFRNGRLSDKSELGLR